MDNNLFRLAPSDKPETPEPRAEARRPLVQRTASMSKNYNPGEASPPEPAPQPVHREPQSPSGTTQSQPLPVDFGYDDEHPLLKIPYSVTVAGQRYTGDSISLMQIHAQATEGGMLGNGTRHIAIINFAFESFVLSLHPEVMVISEDVQGKSVFQFTDPTGGHLPQLRYIVNSHIGGDFVSVDGMISYTGPTAPKKPKGEARGHSLMNRVRSLGVAALSVLLIIVAGSVLLQRYSTSYEMHPVFVERAGQKMRATAAGQISYLNPNAAKGEVLYSVNANTGNVLNFTMPCDCEVVVTKGISDGTTVLQTDLILTIYVNTSLIRAQTLMSIEGLNRAMNGDQVHMDLNDGRSIPVEVIASEATTAASLRGDVFVPVELVSEEGALTTKDIGKSARLRLSKGLLGL
ncbi:hypothetical protein [Parasedimentitalea huanghaiensis]|uniref:Uncharacterized protein n=1 Tax=Parasedimentitalea huanghaiensis TaxID=2682100 RepID=A0A6L6WFI3_9RHOB|nr:hypothetical protein [Zongyanglinia huanghaiensis]MVO16613.1 hypothetical protein [Zongyanglinia huanghaiensis]